MDAEESSLILACCLFVGAIYRHEKMANFAKMSLNCFSMKLLIL